MYANVRHVANNTGEFSKKEQLRKPFRIIVTKSDIHINYPLRYLGVRQFCAQHAVEACGDDLCACFYVGFLVRLHACATQPYRVSITTPKSGGWRCGILFLASPRAMTGAFHRMVEIPPGLRATTSVTEMAMSLVIAR